MDPLSNKKSPELTFDSALQLLKVKPAPNNQLSILSNILGFEARDGDEIFQNIVEAVQSKIGESAKRLSLNLNHIDHKVHQNPWRYLSFSLGAGFIGGFVLSRRFRKRDL